LQDPPKFTQIGNFGFENFSIWQPWARRVQKTNRHFIFMAEIEEEFFPSVASSSF
jgi:hypothetical protein